MSYGSLVPSMVANMFEIPNSRLRHLVVGIGRRVVTYKMLFRKQGEHHLKILKWHRENSEKTTACYPWQTPSPNLIETWEVCQVKFIDCFKYNG